MFALFRCLFHKGPLDDLSASNDSQVKILNHEDSGAPESIHGAAFLGATIHSEMKATFANLLEEKHRRYALPSMEHWYW
jgi:hypothetical protein